MDRQRYMLPTLALITVWRIALLPTLDLCPDEALALLFSQHPDGWHPEMGPLVPSLVWLSTWIAGPTELGVRWLAPVLAFITSVALWRLCRGMFGDTVAAWAVLFLQVLPAFNLAALTMTSCIVGLASMMVCLMALRLAMHRPGPVNRWWVLSAVMLLAAILADWRHLIAWVFAVLALGMSVRRRHHLSSWGFGLITLAMLLGGAWFVAWNVRWDWPLLEMGELEPLWQVWPNVLRWLLLGSPVLLVGMAWALRECWQGRREMPSDVPLLLVFGLGYALLDFGWGPRERWPHMGFPIWMLAGLGLLAHYNLGMLPLSMRGKVVLRTVSLLLAAVQSLIVMRPDLLRQAVGWSFQREVLTARTYRDYWRADPSGNLEGWQKTMSAVDAVLVAGPAPSGQPWFLIARNWPLAVECHAYLPGDVPVWRPTPQHPRVHALLGVERDQPLCLLARYDDQRAGAVSFAGRDAIYISDDVRSTPPLEIRQAFKRWEPLNIGRVMHGGHELRTLSIFACYDYRPPEG
jgi:hypothetical protein